MSARSSPGIFNLPLEIRLEIYQELLCPSDGQPVQLYHDRQGKCASKQINASILQTNKQIYTEAVDILYGCNVFEINLATTVWHSCKGGRRYADDLNDPPPLIRRLWAPEASQELMTEDLLLPEDTNRDCCAQRHHHLGIIDVTCLQRLRHIRLTTSRGAIWAQGRHGYYFSHTGEAILEILYHLASASPTASNSILEFIVTPDWKTKYGIFGAGSSDITFPEKRRALQIASQLEAVKASRAVRVEEHVKSSATGKLERVDVNIERWIPFSVVNPGN